MNIKAVIFSSVAVAGCAGLLLTGFTSSASESGSSREYRDDDHDDARILHQQGDILSLEQILESARRHRDGRVLETELEREGGGYVYEVEMVDAQGVVWEMKLDAQTGELLKQEQED